MDLLIRQKRFKELPGIVCVMRLGSHNRKKVYRVITDDNRYLLMHCKNTDELYYRLATHLEINGTLPHGDLHETR